MGRVERGQIRVTDAKRTGGSDGQVTIVETGLA